MNFTRHAIMENKILKIRILDEANVVVLGLTAEHLDYFYDKYAVNAPNYFFNPKYKLGHWDGKIRFFHKTGKTFLYLIEDLLPRLVRLGYKVELDDLRESVLVKPDKIDENIFKHIPHPDNGQPTVLRPHQVDGVNALIEHGNGIVLAATGAGKTILCAAIAHQYGQHGIKTLTIVPNRDLISQTKQTYIHYKLDTGEYSGLVKTPTHQHVVSTWQALKNNPKIVAMFDLVIVDECHGLKGNVLSKIVTDHAGKMPYRFGVTGTLPKDKSDAWAVHVAVGLVRYQVDAKNLIDAGILANLHIDVLQLQENLHQEYDDFIRGMEAINIPGARPSYEDFKDEYFPDFNAEKSYLQHDRERIEWIASYIEAKRDAKKGNVLCYVDSIPFGRKLAAKVKGSHFVNGRDIRNPADRKKIYDLFATHDDLVVIATVHVAGTGLNIHRIFNLMMVDLGKSFIRVIQAIGRGLRRSNDKDKVHITDIGCDFHWGRKHVRERIKYYNEAKYPHKLHKIKYKELDKVTE